MRNLKIMLVVALGAVLFSSCSRGHGCYYGDAKIQEISPEKTSEFIPAEPVSQDSYTTSIAR